MKVIPAVDIRDGHCVQLVGGSYEHEMVRLDDPVEVARKWNQSGFRTLHIVDLDAATGRGSNRELVKSILSSTAFDRQVGGGIRTTADVDDLLNAGADRVVVGTRALEDHEWLRKIAEEKADRIVVALDIRDRSVVTRGWATERSGNYSSVLSELCTLPLAALLVTAVHREGLMQGTDLDLMREIVQQSSLPIQASGGIGTMDDLRALQQMSVAAVVVGMALYTGALDESAIIEEFAQ